MESMPLEECPIALEINQLSYEVKDDWSRKKRTILKNISLQVFKGESFGFLGHNGAGKTTTIKAILDLIRPQSGTIKIFGRVVGDKEARRYLGYIPEQPYFYDQLSVEEIIDFYACLAGIEKIRRAKAVDSAIDLVGLGARRKSRMRSLSKGLMQRVALAQAIVASPKLLILDEPFSGLDPIGRREFRDIFLNLKKQGVTIFISSHILSDVEFLCDRASIMVKGELKGVYDLKDPPPILSKTSYRITIRSNKNSIELPVESSKKIVGDRYVSFHFEERAKAEEALEYFLAHRLEINSYELEHSSLEDVFMQIVQREEIKA